MIKKKLLSSVVRRGNEIKKISTFLFYNVRNIIQAITNIMDIYHVYVFVKKIIQYY